MTSTVLITIVVILGIYIIYVYNSLVSLRNKVREAFSTMDVYLKLRFDLVPSLVAVVKSYSVHEASTLEQLTNTRSGVGLKELLDKETRISDALTHIFAVVESYPELKADKQFLELQGQLTKIEDDIAFSRRYYNGSVREFNNKCEVVPGNIVAGMFGFKAMPMFAANERERQVQSIEI